VVTKEKMAAVLKEEKAADSTAGNGFHKVKISSGFIEVRGLGSLDHLGMHMQSMTSVMRGVNFNYALLDFIKQARCLQQFLAETFD